MDRRSDMTQRLQGVSFRVLEGITIVEVIHGHKLTPSCGSYGAYTIKTEKGEEYVIWNSLGEVNISQVVEHGS